ncbi:MAG: ERCC4 domain-containing protein [Chloroflexi bacterium]|nr:ERCC4 domain-containing protein [Chloroflexota bacterium]
MREEETPVPGEVLEELERVDIIAFNERGKRLSVVLDRKRYKRCDFLFLTRSYKSRPGEKYEQIFWLTQTSMAQHRPAIKLVAPASVDELTIRIASDERYPWHFAGAKTVRGRLPTGDYALLNSDSKILAVVERKTFDNLMADFGVMPVLHQRLAELATYQYHALVIEAPYSDFLNPKKVKYYTPSFCAQAIGELYALHPKLRIVFCANRKVANQWTQHYFSAIARHSGNTAVSSPLRSKRAGGNP